jgi:hypothetical protein
MASIPEADRIGAIVFGAQPIDRRLARPIDAPPGRSVY